MSVPVQRLLHLIHRWLGIACGGFVLAWFCSGVIMMYVPYPNLDVAEHMAALAPLDAGQIKLDAARAWQTLKIDDVPEGVRLNNVRTRPAYHFRYKGKWLSVWADDGQRMAPLDSMEAGQSASEAAAQLGLRTNDAALESQRLEIDQWTFGGGLDAHRPLYRVALDDAAGSVLYISSTTGELVRDTSRFERGWNWLGSVVHWIYLTPLRVLREPWRQVVMWVSGCGFALVLLGSILGILRLRVKKRYSENRMTPYRGWKRWHHLFGLGAALFTLTWLFSGWLSVNPFNWFDLKGVDRHERIALAGGVLDRPALSVPVSEALLQYPNTREIEWQGFAGHHYVLLHEPKRNTLVDGSGALVKLDAQSLLAAASAFKLPLAGSEWLIEGDWYYYSHHQARPFPVLRLDFADAAETSLYLDPATARIVSKVDRDARYWRWLFSGLHQMDLPWLLQYRPAWDVLLITLLLLGATLGVSGMVLAWRRVKR